MLVLAHPPGRGRYGGDGSLFEFDAAASADTAWWQGALEDLVVGHHATAAVLIEHELDAGVCEHSSPTEHVYLLGADAAGEVVLARSLVTRDTVGHATLGVWDEMNGGPAGETPQHVALQSALARVARRRPSG